MTELARRDPAADSIAKIRGGDFADQVRNALPGGMAVERFVRVTVTALRQNPDVAASDQNALFNAVIRCAQDGLLPDGREAALVLFKGAATYMPMIGGFRKIAAEHGWTIDTHVVYENDEFDYELGVTPRLHHKPAPLNQQPGDKIGAYAVATNEDGRKIVEVLRASEIAKVRNVSRASGRGPWVDWEERMWEKTAGRRIFSKLPLGDRDERVRRMIEASDAEYELNGSPEEQASRRALQGSVPVSPPPDDDAPIDGVVVEESGGGSVGTDGYRSPDAAVEADQAEAASPPAGAASRKRGASTSTTFADMVPPGARGES